MSITSIYFVLLSLIALLLYYSINHKYRIIYLVFLSCGFIASYSYYLLSYILVYSLINYYLGIKIPVFQVQEYLIQSRDSYQSIAAYSS